jgi:hypothetical protein
MFFHRNSSPRFLAFVKLVTLCAATALLGIWLSTNKVQAAGDAYGTFDESGRYGYHSYSGPGRPSLPYQSREYHSQAEEADQKEEQWLQESLRQSRERENVTPPAGSAYQDSYWIQKDGKNTLCVPQYTKGIVSYY